MAIMVNNEQYSYVIARLQSITLILRTIIQNKKIRILDIISSKIKSHFTPRNKSRFTQALRIYDIFRFHCGDFATLIRYQEK